MCSNYRGVTLEDGEGCCRHAHERFQSERGQRTYPKQGKLSLRWGLTYQICVRHCVSTVACIMDFASTFESRNRALDLKAIPVLTKHHRGRSTVMAESNEEKENVGRSRTLISVLTLVCVHHEESFGKPGWLTGCWDMNYFLGNS